MDKEIYDCIVIGAGPAGLSAALFLARYRRRTLTFHHNSPRNLYSHGVHGFLGHDGIEPQELLARGRDEVAKYGGLVVEACVTKVERRGEELFRVSTGDGDKKTTEHSFDARKILLATGLRDLTPDCPGFTDFYGVTVHHCPECVGYEFTDNLVDVLSSADEAANLTIYHLNSYDHLQILMTAAIVNIHH